MATEPALTLASAIAFLAIALVALWRRDRSPLAMHLGLMGASLFAYNFFELISYIHQPTPWDWVEDCSAALSAIPTLHLFFGFVGMSRKLRHLLRLITAYFLGIAAMSLVRFADPSFFGKESWALAMLLGVLPSFSFAGHCLLRHVRRSEGLELGRSQLLLGSLALGVGSVCVDLLATVGAPFPRITPFGLMISSLLLAALILRAKVLDNISALAAANATLVAAMAVLAQLVLVANARTRIALVLVGSVVVILLTVALLRPLMASLHEQRARAEYLATLGRFAEQMAHDLNNPVAAIRGAAQFLQEENAQGRSLDDHMRFVELILERTDRLHRVIRDYQRLGRVQPSLHPIDVNALLDDIVKSQPRGEVRFATRLADGLPEISADRDLLAHAVENLVRNAREAMPQGGEVTVISEVTDDESGLRIVVADDGPGMDARTRDRAVEQFFTTKAKGSGLGLALAARVAKAHGGHLELDSELGRGTRVTIELPLNP